MRLALTAVAALALAGCSTLGLGGSSITPQPQGVGGGPNQLRRAPCACNEVPQLPGIPAHLAGDLAATA